MFCDLFSPVVQTDFVYFSQQNKNKKEIQNKLQIIIEYQSNKLVNIDFTKEEKNRCQKNASLQQVRE